MDPEISVGIAVDFVKGLVVIGRKGLAKQRQERPQRHFALEKPGLIL
jgi:hypothetical protein